MIGITLSPEQIRAAPPEVRRWLEQQIATTLGFSAPQPEPQPNLVECGPDLVRAILGVIHKLPPVAQVFFDLAREAAVEGPAGLRVLNLDDIMRHCNLQAPEQVAACLGTINEALRRVVGKPEVAVAAIDGLGHCVVTDSTARSILAVWEDMVGPHRLGVTPAEGAAVAPTPVFSAPYSISIPAAAVNATAANR
jgi:hypothetical protein